jgi:hypothetical protein
MPLITKAYTIALKYEGYSESNFRLCDVTNVEAGESLRIQSSVT